MKRYRPQQDESEVDITPMLVVVFIMLIFFIVTASFVKEEGVDVKRPSSAQAESKDKVENILVAITETDDIYIDSRSVDVRTVRANIERLMAENPKASVIVQAHVMSRNELLVKVIDAANSAGVKDVNLATIE